MRILLVDVDSKYSNLALMKWAAYFRAQGHEVVLYDNRPEGRRLRKNGPVDLVGWADRTYVSCVFTWNRSRAERLARVLAGRESTTMGGTGVVIGAPLPWLRLPPDVEAMRPDYSLYPSERYAIGFCNRGCPRKCGFCSVPSLEGTVQADRYSPPWEWVPDWAKNAMLLDNEIAIYEPSQQEEIFRWFAEAGVKHAITQGYDLRVIARNPALAELLGRYKPYADSFQGRRVYCAWDYIGVETAVRQGIEALLDAGFKGYQLTCYTIVGFPLELGGTTHSQDLHRFRVLREYGVHPFVMPYNNSYADRWTRGFARFCNQRIFKACAWEKYEYGGFRTADYPVEWGGQGC